MSGGSKVSRRLVIQQIGAAGVAAAATTLGSAGCASLPRTRGETTEHPCDHARCAYNKRVGDSGRCTLVVRVAGGRP